MKYFFWDVQNAPPYDDESSQFQTGFRDEQGQHFRWLGHRGERLEAKMVPIRIHFLWGPPCAWPAQDEGFGQNCVHFIENK